MVRQVTPGPVPSASLSDATPAALGTASAGAGVKTSRDDHKHPMPTAADVGAVAKVNGATGADVEVSDAIVTATVSADYAISMAVAAVYVLTLAGNVTLSASGMPTGRNRVVHARVIASGARTLAFPPAWEWVGAKPSSLAAGAKGLLSLQSFGPVASDVLASWQDVGTGL